MAEEWKIKSVKPLNTVEFLEELCAKKDAKLKEAEGQRDKLVKQLNDLINESRGVIGLHLNGDEAVWDWLIENEWLSALAEIAKGK